MSQSQPMSYSAALGKGADPNDKNASSAQRKDKPHERPTPSISATPANQSKQASPREQSPPDHYRPKTGHDDEARYVLTLRTDKPHHDRMTAIRNKYFPPERNTLRAHLTLFNALPESKMTSSIVPLLEEVAAENGPFKIRVKRPFKMGGGFAVNISPSDGPPPLQNLVGKLQGTWKEEGFLSDQDASKRRIHYTFMNKVTDKQKVDDAFNEFTESWTGDEGVVDGLELWKYSRGKWYWTKKFEFTGTPYLDKRPTNYRVQRS